MFIIIGELGKSHTLFGVTLAHALAAAASTLYSTQDAVHVRGTAPLLVSENVDAKLLLTRLNQADVGQHTIILECAGKLGGDGRVCVQTSQRNQLQNKARNVSMMINIALNILGTYPCLARSQMNDFSDASVNPWPIQLNDGLRL